MSKHTHTNYHWFACQLHTTYETDVLLLAFLTRVIYVFWLYKQVAKSINKVINAYSKVNYRLKEINADTNVNYRLKEINADTNVNYRLKEITGLIHNTINY